MVTVDNLLSLYINIQVYRTDQLQGDNHIRLKGCIYLYLINVSLLYPKFIWKILRSLGEKSMKFLFSMPYFYNRDKILISTKVVYETWVYSVHGPTPLDYVEVTRRIDR